MKFETYRDRSSRVPHTPRREDEGKRKRGTNRQTHSGIPCQEGVDRIRTKCEGGGKEEKRKEHFALLFEYPFLSLLGGENPT